jgi:hypothetical protein
MTHYPGPTDDQLTAFAHWLDTDGPCPDELIPAMRWFTHEVMPTLRRTGEYEDYTLPAWNFFDLLYCPLTGLLRNIRTVDPEAT